MAAFRKVIESTYDGYIIVAWAKSLRAYEGAELCPPQIKKWLEKNEPEKQNCFWYQVRG